VAINTQTGVQSSIMQVPAARLFTQVQVSNFRVLGSNVIVTLAGPEVDQPLTIQGSNVSVDIADASSSVSDQPSGQQHRGERAARLPIADHRHR
jgi:hypothetical protein